MTPIISVGMGLLAILCLVLLLVIYKLTVQHSRFKATVKGRKIADAQRMREQISAALDTEPQPVATTSTPAASTAPEKSSNDAPAETTEKVSMSRTMAEAQGGTTDANQTMEWEGVSEDSGDTPAELIDFKPIEEEDISEEVLIKITDMTDKILRPRSIFSALAIGQLGPKELAEVVASDPEIAAKMLRIVNSAAYGLTKKITSVQRAAIFLGTFLVRDISMRLCMQHSFKKGDHHLENAYQIYWQSSTLASTICHRLANIYGLSEASSLSTRALLSFIGNLVMLSNMPQISQEYSSKSSLFHRTKFEENLFSCNTAVLGGMLARKWRLPEELETGIKHCLVPMYCPPDEYPYDDLRETTICYLSCRVGEQIVFDQLEDLAECRIDIDKGPEYYYLPSYLYYANMEDIYEQLQNVKLRHDVNNIISQLQAQSASGSFSE